MWYGGEDERGLAVHSEDGMLHVLGGADEELHMVRVRVRVRVKGSV